MSSVLIPSRRGFVTSAAAALMALAGAGGPGRRGRGGRQGPHPDPRPSVDGSKVLTAEQLADSPDLIPLYDGIRGIPHVADGIRCQCGCAPVPGYRSLLVCFEETGMARHCEVCQTEGRMVVRLHRRGRTLEQIRAAIDARF